MTAGYPDGLPSELPPFSPWCYEARVAHIYDGDTITLDVDLGFDCSLRMQVRLSGIDAPEIRGEERPEGLEARDALRRLLPVNSPVRLQTEKDRTGKYGRYLGTIWRPVAGGWENANFWMVDNRYAEFRTY